MTDYLGFPKTAALLEDRLFAPFLRALYIEEMAGTGDLRQRVVDRLPRLAERALLEDLCGEYNGAMCRPVRGNGTRYAAL